VKRSVGLVALLLLSALALVAMVGITRPVRVEAGSAPEPAVTAVPPVDAGSLDSILDAVHVEHVIKYGR
jgi:hypothetical protein